MRLQIAKVLPILVLSFLMSEAGAAPVNSTVIAAAASPSGSTANPAVAVSYQNTWPGLIVARQLQHGLSGTGDGRSRRAAAESEPALPVGAAKTSALALSTLGMLGVISLLRLGRTL
ncbi:hypothetical protein [Dechloromonas sp. A34]|uniref:hypothetical protein n=1 Tax=Dechloromonas sp. A34 TaxID=447588 RepID=UPI002248813E|nr:hypothetical protein [Dechloromonas sp. A34]